ncbi:SGNH/GDSL hydrolase family protein [Candidatus Woesearchaeota archaeon]|nr:SGNH/GDSL hydrolase family protein [Candidatus Woesearchaeota archaeon]
MQRTNCKRKIKETYKDIYTFLIFVLLMFFVGKFMMSFFQDYQNDKSYFEICEPLGNLGRCDKIYHHGLIINGYTECKHSGGEWSNISYKTNSLGFRDKEYNNTKCPHCFRILMVGDSFTYGKGVEEVESFQSIVETRLSNREKDPIEVINTGTDSLSTVLEYLKLKNELFQLDPDLVILNFDISDVVQDAEYLQLATYSNKGELIGINGCTGQSKSQKEIFLQSKLLSSTDKKKISESPLPPYLIVAQNEYVKSDFVNSLWNVTLNYLDMIVTMTNERNVSIIIVTYPWEIQFKERFSLDPQKRIINFCKKRDISCLDLTEKFKNSNNSYFGMDAHWNKNGHKLTAESIVTFLEENNIVE